MRGTVLTGRNNIFTVSADEATFLCRLRGKVLAVDERAYNPLAPGDEVELEAIDRTNGTAVITARAERRSSFQRYNRKREAVQTLAANVDLAVAVMSVRDPLFRPRFVDRVLALAEHHGLPALVVVTKADLAVDRAADEARRYTAAGYGTVLVRHDRTAGVEELRSRITGRRCVLVGQSGVGKSTLLNALAGASLQDTATISRRYRRGRHTTTAALMLRIGEVEIVDTPGVRELDCRHIPLDELDACFREFRPYIGRCEMPGCAHRTEPGCAVATAVAAGTLDERRYESYLRLSDELGELEEERR